jgi:Mrp family chromosome partitioning ATPase
MMSSKMGALFDALRNVFDHIILDTAPIGLVADAFTVAPYLDATIYLVRKNYTPKDRIALVDKIFKGKNLPCPMIVLNDIKLTNGHTYGYGQKNVPRKKGSQPSPKRDNAHNDVVTVK